MADIISNSINHHLVEKQAERIEAAMINTDADIMNHFFMKRKLLPDIIYQI